MFRFYQPPYGSRDGEFVARHQDRLGAPLPVLANTRPPPRSSTLHHRILSTPSSECQVAALFAVRECLILETRAPVVSGIRSTQTVDRVVYVQYESLGVMGPTKVTSGMRRSHPAIRSHKRRTLGDTIFIDLSPSCSTSTWRLGER
jgi:hypothetical protein